MLQGFAGLDQKPWEMASVEGDGQSSRHSMKRRILCMHYEVICKHMTQNQNIISHIFNWRANGFCYVQNYMT